MKRFVLASVAATVGAALLLGTANEARANGRFPETNQFFFSKADHDLVLLRVTFGLLISHDRGKTFDWVCEQVLGTAGGIEDPMYAAAPSGRIVGTTFSGVTSTDDRGCTWKFAGDTGTSGNVFIDLAQNPNDPKDIVFFSSGYKGIDDASNSLFKSQLWESKDEGRTFTKLGPPFDERLLGYTVDVTKSDDQRIYVSAVRDKKTGAVLLMSKDHGATWTEQLIPLVGTEGSIWIAGVDPDDAEKVYLRTANNPESPGRLILREKDPEDATKGTFRTLFTSKAPLEGFAISPDNKKVWVGSPLDGVYMASTDDYQFAKASDTPVKCLAAADDGLWACSNEGAKPVGFIAGISQDDGKTFSPLAHFCDIRGPLACPESTTTAQQCVPNWPFQRETLGCDDTATEDGGVTRDAAAVPNEPTATSTTKCDCQAVLPGDGWSALGGAAASLFAAAVAFARRRRRR